MELYGTTTRQLAEVSVAIRYHASLNPDAVMRTPITVEDHEKRPLHRRPAAPARLLPHQRRRRVPDPDQSGARPRLRASRRCWSAASARAKPSAARPSPISTSASGTTRSPKPAKQAYRMAGVTRDDVDALMAYDNFSPTVLFSLEGLGFCPRGEAGPFVEGGTLTLGGKLPTNTDGGHLSNSYMQGWALEHRSGAPAPRRPAARVRSKAPRWRNTSRPRPAPARSSIRAPDQRTPAMSQTYTSPCRRPTP